MKNVEKYIAKGFDRKMAEYFARGRKRITEVEPQDDYRLILHYEDGERRIYDVKPLLQQGTVFEELLNIDTFRRVYLDDANSIAWDRDPNIDSNIVWNNKVDICPDTCYVDSIPLV